MNTPKRRGALLTAGLMTIALTATACGSGGGGSSSDEDAGKPVKGGTLNMLGIGDVDYVDPNITYYSAGAELARLFARSLYTAPIHPLFSDAYVFAPLRKYAYDFSMISAHRSPVVPGRVNA